MNKLYYGDNLDILRSSIEDESIDLIYIDPPFNSKRAYNVLFESIDMTDTKAQKEAFADTWSNVVYIDELKEIQDLDLDLYRFLENLDRLRISKGAVSYLTIMAHRIYYMHKKLKKTGCFYLHCDHTMSHYLKIVCDLIFGEKNYKNEIIWKRTFSTGSSKSIANKFPTSTDTIHFYAKSQKYQFNKYFRPYSEGALKRYDKVDENGKRFKWNPLKTYSEERLKKLIEKGEAKITPTSKYPVYKHYLDTSIGAPVDNLWTDIKVMGTKGQERLDYPTQKPEALLERIIEASSNKGDVVADFFCGCGTTVAVAQRMKRKWIGVDISHLAIRLVYDRLLKPYKEKKASTIKIKSNIEINGFPKDIASAKDLAVSTDKSRLKFQDWVVEVLLNGVSNPKKTADGGYDGHIAFDKSEKERSIALIEVKSGNVTVKNIREFIEVVNREKAGIGAFVCFSEQVTKPMVEWAKKAGSFSDRFRNIDKIQIITVEDLLAGKNVRMPLNQNVTFKSATNATLPKEDNSIDLFENNSE